MKIVEVDRLAKVTILESERDASQPKIHLMWEYNFDQGGAQADVVGAVYDVEWTRL